MMAVGSLATQRCAGTLCAPSQSFHSAGLRSSAECVAPALRLAALRSERCWGRRSVVSMRLVKDGPSVAIAGVTGAVGQEFLQVLTDRNFPYSSLKLLASKRSAGKEQEFEGKKYIIEELTEESFKGIDIALFSAGGSISKKYGPGAADGGTIVVDNSSAFRMAEGVPLVVPEVNPDAVKGWKAGSGKGGIIANPNCSTIIMLVPVTPLHKAGKVGELAL